MIFPELRNIVSPDLEPPALPPDPADCAIPFHALIGPRGSEQAEAFVFLVVTPTSLRRLAEPAWGRGYLIVETFEWAPVIKAIAQLLVQCARPTWEEVLRELDRELRWQPDYPGTAN